MSTPSKPYSYKLHAYTFGAKTKAKYLPERNLPSRSRGEHPLERSARAGTPFALLMIDVDLFKAFNDTYGHQAGDRVLKSVGRILDDNVRKVDYVARYGGEEFAVTAPATPDDGVLLLAERLRLSVEAMPVPWEGRELNITVSIGVGILHEVADAKEAAVAVIRAADEQLYAAKCAGRNRVGFNDNRRPSPAGAAPSAL